MNTPCNDALCSSDKTTTTTIFVEALDCPDEEREIRAALERLPCVESLTFRLFARQVVVAHKGPADPVLDALKRIGMEGRPVDDTLKKADIPKNDLAQYRTFLLAGAALVVGIFMVLLYPGKPLARLPFLASIILGGFPVLLRGVREIRNLSLGMNMLMTISIGGAALLGEWIEASVVVTLFALANLLEARSLDRARRATAEIFASTPDLAVIRTGGAQGEEQTVPAGEVRPGDTLVIRPGERVPVDAVIYYGASDLNEALLTGESLPVEKKEGDPLYAGTVNGRGLLIAHASRRLSDSTYAQILRRVETAQAEKAPVQTFMERFAAIYTPAVLAAAILVAVLPPLFGYGTFSTWTYRALVMLVIACPCAIVLAAPVAAVSALTSATREGILFKGAKHLEALGKIRAIAFDKTGTLTHGRLRVTRVLPVAGAAEDEVLRLAGAVEAGSAHPVAEAIRKEAAQRGVATAARGTVARTFKVIEGQGVSAEVEGKTLYVGNAGLFDGNNSLKEEINRLTESLSSSGGPLLFVGTQDSITGAIELADQVRAQAPETVQALRTLGVSRLVLLTGDNGVTAKSVADAVGINEMQYELLPEDKLQWIKSIVASHGAVAMVGDGVNDAPALAAATVGVAMAAAGSPAAMETADVALLTGDLRKIPFSVALGRKMVSVIRQNVYISIAIKIGFLGLAAVGFSTLWMAVIADMGTSLFVVFNGMRLLARPKKTA